MELAEETMGLFHSLKIKTLDLLYPPLCLHCKRKSEKLLCENCSIFCLLEPKFTTIGALNLAFVLEEEGPAKTFYLEMHRRPSFVRTAAAYCALQADRLGFSSVYPLKRGLSLQLAKEMRRFGFTYKKNADLLLLDRFEDGLRQKKEKRHLLCFMKTLSFEFLKS